MTSRYLRDLCNPLNYNPSRIPTSSLTTNEPYLENLKRQITFHSESLVQSLDDLQDLLKQRFHHNIFPAAEPFNSRPVDPADYNNWKLPRVGAEPNNYRLKDPAEYNNWKLPSVSAEPNNSRLKDPAEYNNLKLLRVGADPNNSKMMDPSKFQLVFNVKPFKEDEVDVDNEDGFVVITAKHEEHVDEYGFISRSTTRRYKLPDDVESDTITSSLSQDGVLTIEVPRKVAISPVFEEGRIVSIEMELKENSVPKVYFAKAKQ